MTLKEAIWVRHSVRRYIDKPIDEQSINTLKEKVEEINKISGLNIQLICNEPKAFKGKMAYGTFSGVTNYFAMVGKNQEDVPEKIGYFGEQLVLLSQILGLNTCWVGVSFNKVKDAYIIGQDEKLYCVIALGYGQNSGRVLKRKSPQKVSNVSESTPEWFEKAVWAALNAPTAVNQQKFFFTYTKENEVEKVKAERKFSIIGYTRIDLGIAKCHFEIGAGNQKFEWI